MKLTMEQSVWVRLTPRGISHLTGEYAKAAVFGTDKPGRLMASVAREAGWFEFPMGELMKTFGQLVHEGRETPFVDSEICLECPY